MATDPLMDYFLNMQQNTGGNYGTGLDPNMLQMILPMVGSMKGANSSMNYMGDFIKMLMSPEFAAMSSTYSPQPSQEDVVATPTLTTWASGANGPLFQQIAEGMLNGRLDQWGAQGLLMQAQRDPSNPASSMLSQFDDKTLAQMTQNAYDEVVKAQTVKAEKNANDPYRKAGLPGMNERYTDDNNGDGMPDYGVPMGDKAAARYADERKRLEDQVRIAEGRYAGQDVNPSFKGWNSGGQKPADGYKAPDARVVNEQQANSKVDALPVDKAQELLPIPVGLMEYQYQDWLKVLTPEERQYYPDHYPKDASSRRDFRRGQGAKEYADAKPADRAKSGGTAPPVSGTPSYGTDRSFDPVRPVAAVDDYRRALTNVDNEMMHAQRAYASQLDAQGRTPLKDNLTQRMALLKLMFGG